MKNSGWQWLGQLLFRRRPQPGFWRRLEEELRRNQEKCLVAGQRQFVTEHFEVLAWGSDCDQDRPADLPLMIKEYREALFDFNRRMIDVEEFERLYSSNKTRENAQILHDKKEALGEALRMLAQRVVAAREAVRARAH